MVYRDQGTRVADNGNQGKVLSKLCGAGLARSDASMTPIPSASWIVLDGTTVYYLVQHEKVQNLTRVLCAITPLFRRSLHVDLSTGSQIKVTITASYYLNCIPPQIPHIKIGDGMSAIEEHFHLPKNS